MKNAVLFLVITFQISHINIALGVLIEESNKNDSAPDDKIDEKNSAEDLTKKIINPSLSTIQNLRCRHQATPIAPKDTLTIESI